MAHRICCPYQRPTDQSNEILQPCRPPTTMDATLTPGFLPQDHPHGATGRRFLLSPVDYIMKSPRLADKIKLKMSKKSTRALRQELDQLAEGHHAQDARVLTSHEVLNMTGSGTFDGTRDVESTPGRALRRFGTLNDFPDSASARPVINSPSIYSRSPSTMEGEPNRMMGIAGVHKAPSASDMHGSLYRSVLPRQPSPSGSHTMQLHDSKHPQQKSEHSRNCSASTESTIQRRLEQVALDCVADPVALSSRSFYYTAQNDKQVSNHIGKTGLGHKEHE